MNKKLMIGAALMVTFIAFEMLATTTAMPAVVKDLDGLRFFPIATGISMATQVFTTLIAGGWVDAKGPRQTFVVGLALFSLGLIASGFAPTMFWFVVGRAVQGLGGGLLLVPLYVLAGYYLDAEAMPTFFTVFSAAWVIPSLIGPALSGIIAEVFSWHWVFFGPVPFVLFSSWPLISLMNHMEHVKTNLSRKNYLRGGVGLLAGSLIVLLQSITTFSDYMFALVAVVGLLGTGLVIPRILPRGTFTAARGVGTLALARFTAMAISGIGDFFIPLVLNRYWNWNLSSAGIGLTIGSITWAIASFFQSRIHDRQWREKLPFIGAVIIIVGVLMLCGLAFKPWGIWVALIGWAIVNFGNGLIMPTISVLALEITPAHRHGRISAYLQTADAVGPSWAMGVIGVMFATTLPLGAPLSFSPAFVVAIICALACLVGSYRIIQRPVANQS